MTAKDEKCEQKMVDYLKSGKPKGKLMSQVHYTLEVTSKKGAFTDTAEYIYGDTYDPQHCLSRDDLKQKFIGNSSPVLEKKKITEVIDSIYTIDEFLSFSEKRFSMPVLTLINHPQHGRKFEGRLQF